MPKKKAAKKKSVKKTATKKKSAKKKAARKRAEVVLEDPDRMPQPVFKRRFDNKRAAEVVSKMVTNVRASIDKVANKSKTRPVRLMTPAMLRKMLIPYDHIFFQYMINSVGIRHNTSMEIIAPDHVGKTTFCFEMISALISMGIYCIYIECEEKQMADSRIKRILHRDPKVAARMLNAIVFAKARTLVECDNVIRQEVEDLRARCDADPDTKGNPIFVFVDPWSGLLPAGEAKGHSDWGLSASSKKEKAKDALTGSNQGHARHAHAMKRWLPSAQDRFNFVMVFINHQNDRVDMSGFKSFVTPSETKNDTRIGGRALKQLCSYRFTMLPMGDLREKSGERRVYGHHVKMTMIKNSYGPRMRQCEWTLFSDNFDDRPDYYDHRVSWAERTATWMANNNLLGTTVEKELYTCDALGCVAVPARKLYDELYARPDLVEFIGSALRLEGFPELDESSSLREQLGRQKVEPSADEKLAAKKMEEAGKEGNGGDEEVPMIVP